VGLLEDRAADSMRIFGAAGRGRSVPIGRVDRPVLGETRARLGAVDALGLPREAGARSAWVWMSGCRPGEVVEHVSCPAGSRPCPNPESSALRRKRHGLFVLSMPYSTRLCVYGVAGGAFKASADDIERDDSLGCIRRGRR
jgi:hypothetical protein